MFKNKDNFQNKVEIPYEIKTEKNWLWKVKNENELKILKPHINSELSKSVWI